MNEHGEENTQTTHHEAAKLEGEVYILLNNNNLYIGSTINIKHRLITHKNTAKKGKNKLYTCMREEGFDNFKHYTVEKITFTHIKELRQLEQHYLNLYKKASFNILNDNESYVNIEAKDKKEYDRLYRKTPKRQIYIKKYNKIYRATDKYKNYLVNYRLLKRHMI
jgi:predicted GIY-YIG superfamily endonuclease